MDWSSRISFRSKQTTNAHNKLVYGLPTRIVVSPFTIISFFFLSLFSLTWTKMLLSLPKQSYLPLTRSRITSSFCRSQLSIYIRYEFCYCFALCYYLKLYGLWFLAPFSLHYTVFYVIARRGEKKLCIEGERTGHPWWTIHQVQIEKSDLPPYSPFGMKNPSFSFF